MSADQVTPDDVEAVVDAAVAALSEWLDRDWHAQAGPLEWDCWETVEHISEALFFYATQLVVVPTSLAGGYPFEDRVQRPGGREGALFVRPDEGPTGPLRALNACGGLLLGRLRTAPPSLRADHMWGASDPAGFAAMAVVEVLVHLHDLSGALQFKWKPNAELCDRTLARLFPDAPTDTGRAQTLLWVTGRGELPSRPRLTDWRWYSAPR